MRISYWSSDVCSSDLARHEQWIFQVRAIDHVRNRQQTIEIDRAIDLEHVIGGQLRNVGQVLPRSEEHTSELQSLMRISYAVFCLKKKNKINRSHEKQQHKHNQHMTQRQLEQNKTT